MASTQTTASVVGTCKDITQLRATETSGNGQIMRVQAYYAGTKGGGGDFYSDTNDRTSADDGGSIIVTTGGTRWKRIYSPAEPGDYRWFGARLDGVTDDRAAFLRTHRLCRHVVFSGQMYLGSGVDLAALADAYRLGLIIEGNADDLSILLFNTEGGGLYYSSGFFRGLTLRDVELRNQKVGSGVGLLIGKDGCEHLNVERVGYRNWKVGRASHQWNSDLLNEVFRNCTHACCIRGTSTHITAPYAVTCSKGYYLGYQLDDGLNPVVSELPFAYSSVTNAAADDVGTAYIAGNCSGITMNSCSAERCKGEQLIDLAALRTAGYASLVWNAFSAYIQTSDTSVRYIARVPASPGHAGVFNSPRISLDRSVPFLSGNGAGVVLNDLQFNLREWSQVSASEPLGLTIDGISLGADSRRPGSPGVSIGAFPRVRNRKGMVVMNPHTQELVLRAGLLNSGLAAGKLLAAEIKVFALHKSGTISTEKAGTLMFSTSYDYAAGIDDPRSINLTRLGALTVATKVRRQDSGSGDAQVIEYRITFEADWPSTQRLLCIDFWCNGIYEGDNRDWYIAAR